MDSKDENDSERQISCETPREPELTSLRFLRWLAERGQLEHEVFGPSCGAYADTQEDDDGPYNW